MKSTTWKVSGLLLAVPLLGAGCNPLANVQDRVTNSIGQRVVEGAIERQIESQSGGKVKADLSGSQGGMVVRNADGSFTGFGEDLQVPAELPTDFVRYPGAKILQLTVDKDKNVGMTQSTTDALDAVLTWFNGQMTGQGYSQETTADIGEGKIAIYKKGNMTFSVTASRSTENNSTAIVLTRSKASE